MTVETHRILMGTCGWNHKAWLNDFYSDDLPEDWQLGFYANEFPLVYVPAAAWLNAADLSEWTEDVSDSFRFILEISDEVLSDASRFTAALEQVKTLADFCLGLVFQLNPSICRNAALFQKHLTMAQAIVPVCVELQGTSFTDEFKRLLLKQNIAEVWDGVSPIDDSLKRGSIAITRIAGENVDMKDLRTILEGCLSASNEDCISVLCLDGDPPSLELLRKADILLNLL